MTSPQSQGLALQVLDESGAFYVLDNNILHEKVLSKSCLKNPEFKKYTLFSDGCCKSKGQFYVFPKNGTLLGLIDNCSPVDIQAKSSTAVLWNYIEEKTVSLFSDIELEYFSTDVVRKHDSIDVTFATNTFYGDSAPEPMEFQAPLDEMEVSFLETRALNRRRGIPEIRKKSRVQINRIGGILPHKNLALMQGCLQDHDYISLVFIVDVYTKKILRQFRTYYAGSDQTALFSPCGEKICMAGRNSVMIFEIESGKKITSIQSNASSIFYSTDSNFLFIDGWSFDCIDLATKNTRWSIDIRERNFSSSNVKYVCFSEGSNAIICSNSFGDIYAADKDTGEILHTAKTCRQVNHAYPIQYSQIINCLFVVLTDGVAVLPRFL